jgi:hypothetical protein
MSAVGPRTGALLGVIFFLGFLGAPGRALGHEFQPCLLELRDLGAGRYEVLWRVAPATSEIGGDTASPTPVFPAHCRRLGSGDRARFTLDCGPLGLVGYPISVEGLAAAKTDAVVRFTGSSSPTHEAGSPLTVVLRADSPSIVLAASEQPSRPHFSSRLACARTYLGAGVEHILRGFDHLLFVFGLLLLVKREAGRGHAAALVRTITAFTAAHSVTLALSALGVVRVPPAPIEAMIALSVFLLAVELARPKAAPGGSAARRPPWVVAFAFGLLHGFGFAGALSNLGLPAGEVPLSLLMFNLGVETGQLVFVLVMVACLWLAGAAAARAPGLMSRSVSRGPVYFIGSIAAYLCVERVAAFWA